MENWLPESINAQAILWGALKVFLILLVARVFLRVLKKGLAGLQSSLTKKRRADARPASAQRLATIFGLVTQAVVLLVWSVTIVVVLDEVGVDIRPILAGAGVIGLAVGFGAQNLVRDFFAGFFIILENQISLGDFASINDKAGIVEAINFRTTVLRGLDGTVHIFPNGEIKMVSNGSHGWSAAVLDVGVSYEEDADQIIGLLETVGDKLGQDPEWSSKTIAKTEVFGLDQFADSALVFKVRLKTLPLEHFGVAREYRKRLKQAFDRAKVTIPFPQRTLHMVPQPDYART